METMDYQALKITNKFTIKRDGRLKNLNSVNIYSPSCHTNFRYFIFWPEMKMDIQRSQPIKLQKGQRSAIKGIVIN